MPTDRANDASDRPVTDHGWATPLINEAYVLGKGLKETPGGFAHAAQEAWNHKGSAAAEIVTSAAAGMAVGYLCSGFGVRGLIGRGIGTAFGLSFIEDGIRPFKDAASAAWNARTQGELDAAGLQLGQKFGDFTFEGMLMTPGAIGGTWAGNKLHLKMSEGLKLPSVFDLKAKTEGKAALTGAGSESIVATPPAESGSHAGADSAAEAEKVAPVEGPQKSRFNFVTLNPAADVNPRFDFGIEVTESKLLNGQPNLDHHGSKVSANMPSAIEQALALPADQLPKPGSTLATIKHDADSLGAMAVLANRIEGRPVNQELVEAIGRRDRGVRDTSPISPELSRMLAAIQETVKSGRPIHKKVFFLKDCLDGSVNDGAVRERAEWRRERNREMRDHIEDTVQVKPYKDVRDVVLLTADTTKALSHGYQYAPISILHVDTPTFKRISVGVQEGSTKGKYLGRALQELQTIEPGWGGRPTIFGSPHGKNTTLTPDVVASVVSKYINPPPYQAYYWDAVDKIGVQEGTSRGRFLPRAFQDIQSANPATLTAERVEGIVNNYVNAPIYKRIWWDAMDYLAQSRPVTWFKPGTQG